MNTKKKLKQILKNNPLDSKANESLAYIYANEGDLEKAHELLLISNRDRNSSAESNFYLGISYSKRKEYVKAVHFINLAISKNGYFYEGLMELAIAYGYLKEYKRSEEILIMIINIYPKNKDVAYINLGKLKSTQKKIH
jgi:tetratricopeptide (TPR) repeat protein